MRKTREEYVALINNSLLFFSADKASDDHKDEYRYLQNHIAEYYKYFVWSEKDFEKLGLELIVTIKDCVSSYKKESGNFINYLGVALAKARRKALGIDAEQTMRCGIKIGSRDSKLIRQIVNACKMKGLDIDEVETHIRLASAFGISVKKVVELIKINYDAVALGESLENDNGETIIVFDRIATDETPESLLDNIEQLAVVLKKISIKVELQKPGIRKVVASIITLMLIKFGVNEKLDEQQLAGYNFFDKDMYQAQLKLENDFTDKEIAIRLNVSPAYISKVKKSFFIAAQ